MKKRIFSILLVVVMTLAMVACGTQETTNDAPVSTETIEATVESGENSEAVSETEQATEAPVDEVVENAESVSETESAESASEPETSTEVLPDSEAVESEASEPESSETASTPDSEAVEFTVTELTATKYATQSVNVRSGPSTDYDKIGGLTTNQEVQVTGQASTGWYRIEYNGSEAYVSGKYLSDSKVEVQAPANNSGSSGGQTSNNATTECPYPMLQIIDEGGDKVYYYYTASTQNINIYKECASIIASRHGWYIDVVNGGTAGFGGANSAEKTNYTYNGEVVYRARPCTYLIGPNGGGPSNALEVVICP